ncbi:hypothetical protein M5M_13105 [Simiduia agarivorans SA1 = DSM 21679]|uniref:Uncharacterized protein n=1 Tax=Simiduia agarivorans (strain DSM 21679 / JCM 13881 / BCRC 17597 / SA1) TaxID=1117647 RepID=K4KNG5_SIMAS|nr:hypothetical protein M5M_13105 [Simiduia agarivorans SA1 = DSM 21679]
MPYFFAVDRPNIWFDCGTEKCDNSCVNAIRFGEDSLDLREPTYVDGLNNYNWKLGLGKYLDYQALISSGCFHYNTGYIEAL